LIGIALRTPPGSPSCSCDAPEFFQLKLQDPCSSIMEGILLFNKHLLFVVILIILAVSWLLSNTIYNFDYMINSTSTNFFHSNPLEIIWTSVPALLLVMVGFPSVKLIQFMDKVDEPELTLKVVGSQWYWNYEIPEIGVSFESRIIPSEDIGPNQIRLLEVDEPLLLPINTKIRVLVTSSDVLHSWAVPAFAFKKDCTPGRISESWIDIQKEGVYYGQCSELCGMDHGFMPIKIYAVSKKKFLEWAEETEGDPNVTDFVNSLTVDSISFSCK